MTWQGAGNGVTLERRKWIIATWQRQGVGKRLALQGNVFAVTWESSGKAVKAHSGVLCPDGPCFTQVLTPSKMEYGDMARCWQRAAAAGRRVRGDRGKQWQGGKWIMATWPGTGTGLPLQGNVCAVTWEGSGKAVKAHRRVLCRDGPCFAHVLKPSKWSMATWPGAGKGLPLQGNVFAVTWESSGKAVKAHRRVLCRDGPCFAHVLKPSKWSMATWPGAGTGLALQGNVFAVTWESSGKAVKAHSGVLCPDGPCFTQVLTPSKMEYGDMARRWQRAAAAGQRVRGDRGKQWQGGKWIMATWPGTGTGLPLQGNVCAVTWEGSGKAVKAHRRVLCRDGPCFAHVLKPSKWSMATWPGAGKGLPLQGNVCAVTWEGSGKAVKAHRRVLCRDGPCFAHVLKPSINGVWRHGQALAKGCRCRATCVR